MELPGSDKIDVGRLSQVFNNTTASYKYYWFMGILELLSCGRGEEYSFVEVIGKMISNAWYPIHYFKLSFGVADQLAVQCRHLQEAYLLHIESTKAEIEADIATLYDTERGCHQHLLKFGKYVPYKFLSPWFPRCSEAEVVRRSQGFECGCPYAIYEKTYKRIVLNPMWVDYLRSHIGILLDFCRWNLVLFLQTRNPYTPDIANKLIRPLERSSLKEQRNYWYIILGELGGIDCIYTGRQIERGDFDLDHFIPWSFVAHDFLWNLVPADASINSSKNNRLPELDRYLVKFAHLQRLGLNVASDLNIRSRLLDDFLHLGASRDDLLAMPEEKFVELYRKTMSPLCQIAENMGFEQWKL